MHFLDRYLLFSRRFLPSPFSIAIILTVATFLMVWCFNYVEYHKWNFVDSFIWWNTGIWETSMLEFTMQMMLMLVLGHTLALAPGVQKIISRLSSIPKNTSQAAALVALCAMITALFNWGLGLIFGAIMALSTAQSLQRKGAMINFGIIGAAGYSGLMIWHAGLSGSALLKSAEPNSLKRMMAGVLSNDQLNDLPASVSLTETALAASNILTILFVLILVPLALYLVGKTTEPDRSAIPESIDHPATNDEKAGLIGAERMDGSVLLAKLIGFLLVSFCLFKAFSIYDSPAHFFVPNNINLLLLGLAIFSHKHFHQFLNAVENAMGGAAGILIQFPLYFGIMGLIKESGMVVSISRIFLAFGNEFTIPLFTYLSAALVNIFVPSGGGQWALQGPIVIKSALDGGMSIPKGILALAYGDQITNMLQPFWALPLLGITKLNAKDIFPFTALIFLVGFIIYGLSIVIL